jgi:uncharacterized protein YmfQ (DUF2313 family)
VATVEQYTQFLQNLLPRGVAWTRDPASTVTKLIAGLADELVRIDGRATTLLNESDPRQSNELLTDWERVTGLSDNSGLDIVQARRDAVATRLAQIGGQSRAYFIALAKAVGFEITITEFRPARVGRVKAGDRLSNGDWRYVWRVHAPSETVRRMRVGSGKTGERIAVWGNSLLENTIVREAPAHTKVEFAYGNEN